MKEGRKGWRRGRKMHDSGRIGKASIDSALANNMDASKSRDRFFKWYFTFDIRPQASI